MTRSDEFQKAAISRLEAALSIADENIIPVQIAQTSDDLDPRVSVGASLNSTERANLREETTGTVRVIVDGTQDFVATNGTLRLTEIQSNAVDELTENRPGWKNPGVSNEDEVAWSDDLNRYVGVVELTVDADGIHPTYE